MRATRGRRRLDAGARRETILEAAIPAFASAGYERTRVSDIAATVGVSEPVVFQNFGTKAGLFVAVLDRVAGEVVRHLAGLGERFPDVAGLLSVLLSPELQDLLHGGGGLGSLFAEAAASQDAAVHEAGHRANARTVEALGGLVRAGQAAGSIRADVDPASAGWLLLSQIHARQMRRRHGATSPELEKAFLDALLTALRPAPG